MSSLLDAAIEAAHGAAIDQAVTQSSRKREHHSARREWLQSALRSTFLGTALPHFWQPAAHSPQFALLTAFDKVDRWGVTTRSPLRFCNRDRAKRDVFLGSTFTFPQGNCGYVAKAKISKPFRLRADVSDAVTAALRTVPVETVAQPQHPAFPQLPTVLPQVTPEEITKALAVIDARIAVEGPSAYVSSDRPLQLQLARNQLAVLHRLVTAYGGLPNGYIEYSNGRVGPQPGELSMFHVCNLHGPMRKLVLQESGLWDYDLSLCHWRVLRAIAPDETRGSVLSYIVERDRWVAELTEVLDVTPSQVKAAMTAYLLNQSIVPSRRRRLFQVLAYDRDTLAKFETYVCENGLADELPKALAQVAHRARDEWQYTNAVGAVLPTEKRADVGKVASHLLTGIEQCMVRAMGDVVPDMQAVVYDGFIAPRGDINLGSLQQSAFAAVQRATGLIIHPVIKPPQEF